MVVCAVRVFGRAVSSICGSRHCTHSWEMGNMRTSVLLYIFLYYVKTFISLHFICSSFNSKAIMLYYIALHCYPSILYVLFRVVGRLKAILAIYFYFLCYFVLVYYIIYFAILELLYPCILFVLILTKSHHVLLYYIISYFSVPACYLCRFWQQSHHVEYYVLL